MLRLLLDEHVSREVTVCGENNNLDWRAPFGVTIQKRTAGVFSSLAEDASIATDPTDTSFYKRVRVSVSAQGSDFEVRVTGWDTTVTPPVWDTGRELVLAFSDSDHADGRVGVGTWGQSGGSTATASNPVSTGALVESVIIESAGTEVFRETWEGVPLAGELPAGWDLPQSGAAAGTWQASAHGTILQTANYSTPTTGAPFQPRADGEGSILLAPSVPSANQRLEIGFHPFDDDGIGFVYDYQDLNNFARVLFVSEPTAGGRVPQGLSISRKVNGTWSDLVAGDTSFLYRNGTPFRVEFAHRNGAYRMTAQDADDPARSRSWAWVDSSIAPGRRFGLTTWGETDAHFLHAGASEMPSPSGPGNPRIVAITLDGGTLTLGVTDLGGQPYTVERTESVTAGPWSVVASDQTGANWSTPIPAGSSAGFYRLRQNR
ncbi:MAG: hypothetical protein AB7O66_07565 [Limisphaerales bacterium]